MHNPTCEKITLPLLMFNNKAITPWKCHTCGRTFDTGSGGICKKYNQPTCNICFGLAKLRKLSELKLPEPQVCRSCAKLQ